MLKSMWHSLGYVCLSRIKLAVRVIKDIFHTIVQWTVICSEMNNKWSSAYERSTPSHTVLTVCVYTLHTHTYIHTLYVYTHTDVCMCIHCMCIHTQTPIYLGQCMFIYYDFYYNDSLNVIQFHCMLNYEYNGNFRVGCIQCLHLQTISKSLNEI